MFYARASNMDTDLANNPLFVGRYEHDFALECFQALAMAQQNRFLATMLDQSGNANGDDRHNPVTGQFFHEQV